MRKNNFVLLNPSQQRELARLAPDEKQARFVEFCLMRGNTIVILANGQDRYEQDLADFIRRVGGKVQISGMIVKFPQPSIGRGGEKCYGKLIVRGGEK